MSIIALVGIDPGIINTGVVGIQLDNEKRTIKITEAALPGEDADAVRAFVVNQGWIGNTHLWIERYRQRGTVFGNNDRMTKLENEIKAALPYARLMDNTGVKKVVKDDLMKLLHVWHFKNRSFHQDVRSAARIALYGALKDPVLNDLISTVVYDSLEGRPWKVK